MQTHLKQKLQLIQLKQLHNTFLVNNLIDTINNPHKKLSDLNTNLLRSKSTKLLSNRNTQDNLTCDYRLVYKNVKSVPYYDTDGEVVHSKYGKAIKIKELRQIIQEQNTQQNDCQVSNVQSKIIINPIYLQSKLPKSQTSLSNIDKKYLTVNDINTNEQVESPYRKSVMPYRSKTAKTLYNDQKSHRSTTQITTQKYTNNQLNALSSIHTRQKKQITHLSMQQLQNESKNFKKKSIKLKQIQEHQSVRRITHI